MGTDKERGQVLLIIILVMAVALTVGLSFISRSITTLRTSKEEASSQKALSAAEAGIEELLKANTTTSIAQPSFAQNTSYTASSTDVLGTNLLVYGGNTVPKDEGADIWLVSHNADSSPNFSTPWTGDITIYWGDTSGPCNNAALEIIVIYDALFPKQNRYAFDPCVSRASNNNFTPALGGGTVNGISFSFSTPPLGDPGVISIVDGFVARVVPLYASSSIGVNATTALPSQGLIIDSIGDSGGTKRKLLVFKGYPQLPIQYFSYGLFSP